MCKGYGDKGIHTRWKKGLGGTGICPICHQENPKHVLKDSALLKSLNLKLIHVALVASPPAPAPAASAPVEVPPFPGGRVATADLPPSGGLNGSATASFGLTACTLNVLEEFDSGDNFCWEGDESGTDYVDHSRKSNKSAALDPLCSSVTVPLLPHLNSFELPMVAPNSMTVPSSSPTDEPITNCIISLLLCLHQLIQRVSHSSIGMFSSKRVAMANTGAPTIYFIQRKPLSSHTN